MADRGRSGRTAPVVDVPDPGWEAPPVDARELLPEQPIELRPDPLIGPILRRFTRYYVGRDAIKVRSGVLRRVTRQIELWRVGMKASDLEVVQGPLQRMRGTGDVIIHSSDPDTPRLVLEDVHQAERLLDMIRRSAARQQVLRTRWNVGAAGGGDHDPGGEPF